MCEMIYTIRLGFHDRGCGVWARFRKRRKDTCRRWGFSIRFFVPVTPFFHFFSMRRAWAFIFRDFYIPSVNFTGSIDPLSNVLLLLYTTSCFGARESHVIDGVRGLMRRQNEVHACFTIERQNTMYMYALPEKKKQRDALLDEYDKIGFFIKLFAARVHNIVSCIIVLFPGTFRTARGDKR